MTSVDSNDSAPTLAGSPAVDSICEKFASDLRLGEDTSIESVLEGLDDSVKALVFKKLLRVELEHRVSGGFYPDRLEYESRFPQFTEAITEVFRGIGESRWGETRIDDTSPKDVAEAGEFQPREFGEYDLIEEIARGGMGVVYRARQRRLKRTVAIKMIRAGELAGPEQVRRFHVEAEAAAQLHHPGIVPIYEVGELEGLHFFSMRFVDGKTLSEAIDESPLPPREAVRLMSTVCEAVEYAHQHGVIHRDLKPGNILLAETDGSSDDSMSSSRSGSESWSSFDGSKGRAGGLHPLVTDFGLAKLSETDSELTSTGQIIGTPSYISPEQARGGQVGPATDIYGLGAVLYAALTGHPPFRAASAMETLRQVVEQEPVPPQNLNAAIDRDLATVCLKCLEKEPSRRYPSAGELRAELARILRGEPIKARSITSTTRVWRWCRRNPALAGLVIALSSLMIVLAVGGPVVAFNQALLREEAGRMQRTTEAAAQRARDYALNEALARAQTRRYLYVAQMNLGQQAWEVGDAGRVRELLSRHHPETGVEDLRGFEWYYLWRLSHRYALSLQGHADWVKSVVVSPDGKTLASASSDETVKLWDVSSGKLKATLKRHNDHVRSVAFSPDGNTLASGAGDRDGPGEIILWDMPSGKVKRFFIGHAGEVQSVAFSPDGKTLASASYDQTVKLWDAASGTLKRTLAGHEDQVNGVAFSADGGTLASGSFDGSVKLWDPKNGELKTTLQQTAKVTAVAFSEDGRFIASATTTGSIEVFERESGQSHLSLRGHELPILDLAFSPNSELLASASLDDTVRLWDLSGEEPIETLRGHTGHVTSVTFTPDSKTVVSGSKDDSIKVWPVVADVAPTTVIREHRGAVRSVVFSPDHQTVASAGADRIVRLCDAGSGKLQKRFTGHTGDIRSVAFSSDGNLVASASEDKTVIVWDLDSDGRTVFSGHIDGVTCVSFSPDAKLLASGSSDRTVRLWDPSSGEYLTSLMGQTDEVLTIAFSPDNKSLAAAGHSHAITLWDVETGQVRSSIPGNAGARALAYSPDGSSLACAGSGGVVNVYDVATGELLFTLKGHTGFIHSLAFSPGGKTLISASRDATVKLWDMATGEQKASLEGHSSAVSAVSVSSDGATLASGSWDSTVRIWRAATEAQVQRHERAHQR